MHELVDERAAVALADRLRVAEVRAPDLGREERVLPGVIELSAPPMLPSFACTISVP
jgi:hypothetical protein